MTKGAPNVDLPSKLLSSNYQSLDQQRLHRSSDLLCFLYLGLLINHLEQLQCHGLRSSGVCQHSWIDISITTAERDIPDVSDAFRQIRSKLAFQSREKGTWRGSVRDSDTGWFNPREAIWKFERVIAQGSLRSVVRTRDTLGPNSMNGGCLRLK